MCHIPIFSRESDQHSFGFNIEVLLTDDTYEAALLFK